MSEGRPQAQAEPALFEPMPSHFSTRMSLGFSAQFLFVGLYLPYFPLWLNSKNLSPFEISTILAMPLLIRVLTSGQITVFADSREDRSNVLSALYVASALSILLYLWTESFWAILAVTLLYNLFFNPLLPLLDAITLAGVRRFGADYGRIRLWGSMVFILANLGGGALLAGFAPGSVLLALIASLALGAVVSFALPRIGRQGPSKDQTAERVTRRKLLTNPVFVLVLAASGLAQASHALLYGFGSIHWQALGYGGLKIGLFWAVGVISEIVLFQYATGLLKRIPPVTVIAIGCAGGILRWLLFPLVEGDAAFLLLQVLHGLSFGAVHIGTMHFIMDSVPENYIGAAQGAGYVLGGVAMGVAVFVSGPIYAAYGVNGFWIMAAMCVAALGLTLIPKAAARAD
jgi:PPP family 3-phenylpropionic acid transporter